MNLPNAVEVEKVLIGSIFTSENPRLSDSVVDLIDHESFFESFHGLVWQVIRSLVDSGMAPDPATVAQRLADRNGTSPNDYTEYLTHLLDSAPMIPNMREYATIIAEKKRLRKLIATSQSILSKVTKPTDESVDEIMAQAANEIRDVTTSRSRNGLSDMSSMIDDMLNGIQKNLDSGEEITGTPTGFNELDEITSGLQESDLIIVAGRPSMGKTSFAMNIAQNVLDAGKRVAVFSLEMPKNQLLMRLASSMANIEFKKLRSSNLMTDMDWTYLTSAISRLQAYDLHIDDTPSMPVSAIRAELMRLVSDGKMDVQGQQKNVDLIIIDYLQLMTGESKSTDRRQVVDEISRSLKALAKEFKAPVIALSQLNRELEKRADKRPIMADLRESGAIEQDADLILFVYRDEVYYKDSPEKGVAEIIIGKQRNGPLGTIPLAFDNRITRFSNMDTAGVDYDDMN